MTKNKRILFRSMIVAMIIFASLLISCQTQQITQGEIAEFIDDFESTAEYLKRMIALHEWHHHTNGYSDSLADFRKYYELLTSNPKKLNRIRKYLGVNTQENLRRKLEILHRLCLRMVIDHDLHIRRLIDSLADIGSDIERRFEGEPHTPKQLYTLMATEKSRFRRRKAYEASVALGDTLEDGIVSLVRMRNQFARKLGYNSYYDLMLFADGINKEEYLWLLDELEELSEDRYQQAIDSLRRISGISDLQAWDIAYAIRDDAANLSGFYQSDYQMKVLKATFNGLGFKLDAWPIYFAPSLNTDEITCAPIFPVYVPFDIRVPTNIAAGPHSLAQLFQQAGKAIYSAQIDRHDFLLSQTPAPCFSEGMARFMSALTETDAWRRKYAGMPEPLVVELAAKRDFLRLYNLRYTLVRLRFEHEMYKDPFTDMNRLYSDIFEKLMLFPSPPGLSPWAANLEYVLKPVDMQNRLLGDCIASQTFHYLFRKYGAVLDSYHTREILVQNFYRFGARDDWQTLLARGTGEKLNPRYYIDYRGD